MFYRRLKCTCVLLLLIALGATGLHYWFATAPATPKLPIMNDEPAPAERNPMATRVQGGRDTPWLDVAEPGLDEALLLQEEAFQAQLAQWLASLNEATQWPHQLAAVLVEKDVASQFVRLQQLLQQAPHHPLLNVTLIELCIVHPQPEVCDASRQASFVWLAGDNGSVQDLHALYALQLGDEAEALAAVHAAAHSAYSHHYSAQYMAALAQSMTEFGIEARSLSGLEALIGYESVRPKPQATGLVHACRERMANEQWRAACLARGRSLMQTTSSLLARGVGIALAEQMAQDGTRYSQEKALLQQDISQLGNSLTGQSFAERWAAKQQQWRMNEAQWQQFLLLFEYQGEQAAFVYLGELLAAANAKR